jgi:hypothetical protein
MRRSLWTVPGALVSVAALAILPLACQGGGVGDPCTPEEEYVAHFTGFDVSEEYIESRSFQCATRVCLVNHFQGRVSCPLGQTAADVHPCSGPDDASCGAGQKCTPSETFLPPCNPCDPKQDPTCAPVACPAGLTCDPDNLFCTCDSANSPTFTSDGATYACAYSDPTCVPGGSTPCKGLLQSYVCHVPGACQSANASAADNQGKACCVPGTDAPVSVSVCGQCSPANQRDAAGSVYCSCRCAVADGAPAEPDFDFCTCPGGYTCSEIRPDLNLGDPELTGKYCIKAGSAFTQVTSCGSSPGNHDPPCAGATGP